MDTSKSSSSDDKNDSYIPPPTDPYVTYQTPYPRRPSEEVQNPFIEFRRLADSAFSSFFSSLPRYLGTEKFKEANIRESDQAYVEAFNQQAKDFENRIAEMVRARAEEAEGFRKKLEQEWEERRRDNEKRMEEENRRWEMMRRGLERCPGLRPDGVDTKEEAETELDLYNGLKAYDSPLYRPNTDQQNMSSNKCPWKDEKIDKKCPWSNEENQRSGWFSSLGWDGRRRARHIPLYIASTQNTEKTQETNVNWQEYKDEEMDPFENDDHLVPWLRLSPYSPLSLINKRDWTVNSNQQRYGTTDEGISLSDLPWDEAFEDLISVQRTGKLPSLVRRLVYWGGPNQWMTDMVLRGSLGSKWEEGYMVAALMGATDGKRWKGFDGLKEQCVQLAGREFRDSAPETMAPREKIHNTGDEDGNEANFEDWVNVMKEVLEPRVWEAYREMEEHALAIFKENRSVKKAFGAHGMTWPSPEEVINAISEGKFRAEDNRETEEERTAETKEATPVKQDSWSSSSVTTSSRTPKHEEKQESLVSKLATTSTRTLPDGSIETKRVLKKRFADGREENSESTEVNSSPKPKNNDSAQTGLREKEDKKSGWFWN